MNPGPLLLPWLRAAATLLYPPTCAGCEASLEAGEYLCAACGELAPRLAPPFCAVCSDPFKGEIPPASAYTCFECRAHRPAFEYAVCSRRHEGLARDLVLRFKYNGHQYLRQPLGRWLADALDDPRLRVGPPADALVPVPLHPRRERERGFNQAEVLCRALGKRAGLPVWPALRRARATRTQTALTHPERRSNVRGAIAPAPRCPVEGKHLLLVDDVFTTGSTADECARVLRQTGAAGVRVLTVARRV